MRFWFHCIFHPYSTKTCFFYVHLINKSMFQWETFLSKNTTKIPSTLWFSYIHFNLLSFEKFNLIFNIFKVSQNDYFETVFCCCFGT